MADCATKENDALREKWDPIFHFAKEAFRDGDAVKFIVNMHKLNKLEMPKEEKEYGEEEG